jgi:hypothetical protein
LIVVHGKRPGGERKRPTIHDCTAQA